MVERHKRNRLEVRRRVARPRSGAAIGPRALTVIVVVVALVLAAASAASGHPQRSSAASAGQPQWILFTAQPPGFGVEQIFRVQPSGKGLKQLTKGKNPSEAPAFSPDGKRIAFARLGAGIFSMNVDGSGLRALTTNDRDSFPAWSPDGKQIAFIRPTASAWRVHVMSASGAGQRQLRQAPPAGRPSWTKPWAPDSDERRPREDRSSIRACAEALWRAHRRVCRHERDRCLPRSLHHDVRGRPNDRSRGPWLRRGRALSDVRALHPGSSHAQGAAGSRTQWRTGVVLARRKAPRVRGSESARSPGLSRTARRSRSRPGSSH